MRVLIAGVMAVGALLPGMAANAQSCGELIAIETYDRSTTRYSLVAVDGAKVALVLLVGGGGNLNLDDNGCPRSLNNNVLVRSRKLYHDAGVATALVDATSGFPGPDGLAEHRNTARHAGDLGKVIADVRKRTNAAVWVMGHSRGTISAANAAARLSGPAAPDGAVLLSAMLVGETRARKALAMQTAFDVPLDAIRAPFLMIGHAADNCTRSPANVMVHMVAKTQSARRAAITITGGPIAPGRPPGIGVCEVGQPHDFVDQQAELVTVVTRFMRAGSGS